MTELLSVAPANLARAAEVIRAGGLVAFPTETVYGLGANALDLAAIQRIFVAKGRPTTDPLIVHIGARAQLDELARDVPPLAHTLAAHFWPGPLTFILAKQSHISAAITAGRSTVAVRWPAHPVAQALLCAAQTPIAAPSANRFAHPSPTTAAHVLADLDGQVDIVLDGGATGIGVESTIVDVTVTPPVILRPGGLPVEALRAVCGDVRVLDRYRAFHETAETPGQFLKHYSPRAELRLVTGDPATRVARARAAVQGALKAGQRVGLLLPGAFQPDFSDLSVIAQPLSPDPTQAARALFGALRALDATGVDLILAFDLDHRGLGLAVWDRLYRAAEGKMVMGHE